jgi:large subunit ribosomal protein L9
MKVILRKDIENVGKTGDVADVKEGYARNYLIPGGLAFLATPGNVNRLEKEKKKEEALKRKDKKDAEELKNKIEALSCTIARKTEQENKLFGSVTPADIAESLLLKGVEIDKKKIEIAEPIREFGVYNISVRIHPEVEASIKIWVVKE